MTSRESRNFSTPQPLPTAEQVAVQRIAEIETQALSPSQNYQATRDALEPEGPYKNPIHRREAAEHAAHYLLSHPPVTNTQEARWWVEGPYMSHTTHQLASLVDVRVSPGESYTSAKTSRRVVETIAEAVMNDPWVKEPIQELNQVGETLMSPAMESAHSQDTPEGAKVMARGVINATRVIQRESVERAKATQIATPTPSRRYDKWRAKVGFTRVEQTPVPSMREAVINGIESLRNRVDFHTLTQATLTGSAQEIRDMGKHAQQYVVDLMQRNQGRLSEYSKTQLVEAARQAAHRVTKFVSQVSGVGDSLRATLNTVTQRLEDGTRESVLAVGREIRDYFNSRTTGEQLGEFSNNPERAAVQASQLIVEWAGEQLQTPLTPEQVATQQAYKNFVESIAVGVNGETYFKGNLSELAPEREFRSAADRSVDLTVNGLRQAIAPVVAVHIKDGGSPSLTAYELIERSGRAVGAERALIVDQMINLSSEDAFNLERARREVLERMTSGTLVPETLSANERALFENQHLLRADLTQRGSRLTALSNQWTKDGRQLNPERAQDQHRGVARLAGNIAEGVTDSEKAQTGIVAKSQELTQKAEETAKQVSAAEEERRRLARERAQKLTATLFDTAPLVETETPARTQYRGPIR